MTDTTDTPIARPTFPPPSRVDQAKGLIGDLARPFTLYAVGLSVAVTIYKIGVALAAKNTSFSEAAIYLGAVGTVFAIPFGVKSVENIFASHNAAKIEVAKANAPGAGT